MQRAFHLEPIGGILAGIAITALVVVVFSLMLRERPGASPAQSGYPGPATPAGSPYPTTVNGLPFVPWKETALAQHLATLAANSTPDSAVLTPFDKNLVPSSPTPRPDGAAQTLQRPAGAGRIVEGLSLANWRAGFDSADGWTEKTGDTYILVIAGEQLDTAGMSVGNGTVFVIWLSLAAEPGQQFGHKALQGGGEYPTPTRAGKVFIIAAVGEQLTLRAADGTLFNFDVATQSYLNTTPQTSVEHPLGLGTVREDGAAPFASPGLKFWNQWSTVLAGSVVTVFAGADGGPYGQAALVVVDSRSAPTASDSRKTYYAPNAGGMLRIVDVRGDQIIVEDAYRTASVFDISSRRFLDPSEMKLPLSPLFD